MVAAPEPDALREAAFFVERLTHERMPLAGLVVNRVTDLPSGAISAEAALAATERLGKTQAAQLTSGLLRLHAERVRRVARETRLQERFAAAHPGVRIVEVPAQPGDVHDLDGLQNIGTLLAR